MARVKSCEVCGHPNPPNEVFCLSCGASLADVPVTDADAARPAAGPVEPPTPAGTFREPAPLAAQLIFDWGPVPVVGGLRVGRDAQFSALGDRIAAVTSVSRRHAELFVQDGRLFVRHLGETNPTYVNGHPLATGEALGLDHGAEILFSRALRAVVDLG